MYVVGNFYVIKFLHNQPGETRKRSVNDFLNGYILIGSSIYTWQGPVPLDPINRPNLIVSKLDKDHWFH